MNEAETSATTCDSISRGLNEAVAHAKGKKVAVKIYKPEPVDVSALRQRMGMTQEHKPRGLDSLLRRCGIGSAGIARHKARRWCC